MALDHPPRPRLTLNVGITGHRASLLPPAVVDPLVACLDTIFTRMRDSVERLHVSKDSLFSAEEPVLRLHTPLATGADQLAAGSARNLGYTVRALLPFPPAEYSNDFADVGEHTEFARHLDAADEVFALPGERSSENAAYVLVGKGVIAAADILIAVWDGQEGSGPGGTAHVVDLALRGGVPIIHVQIDRESTALGSTRLLLGGDAVEPIARTLSDSAAFDKLIAETLAQNDPIQRELTLTFYKERETLTNLRVEYPLLLAMLRIRRLPPRPWKQSPVSADLTSAIPNDHELAYAWANFLAIRNAQKFRSGDLTNYALSVLAVFIALSGYIVPDWKVYLVMAELVTIGLLFYNTNAGRKGDWHRKWLQYRHLAESLRPMVYLRRTGMVGPPFRTQVGAEPRHRRKTADWTSWYSSAIWREMPSPTGVLTKQRVAGLVSSIIAEQIVPQATYHAVNSKRMHRLDHRLQELGHVVMAIVIGAAFLYIIGYYVDRSIVKLLSAPFVVLTAGLPTLGAALFGLRGHGEHLLAASRSASMVEALNENAERLRRTQSLEAATMEMENTATVMLADLNEWTVSYSERSLEIPG